MSTHDLKIILACCGYTQNILFATAEAPYLDEGVYRKSVSCEGCGSFLILDCDTNYSDPLIQQEIVQLP